MNSRLFYCPVLQPLPIRPPKSLVAFIALMCALFVVPCTCAASSAPAWMHDVANAPLPPHDEKTDVVVLYSEEAVSVLSTDKVITHVREVYKILRPFRNAGWVEVPVNGQQKITSMKAWCIPASGKDYEVREKDSVEVSAPNVPGSELIDDLKYKFLEIPAAEPGNVLGYEYEIEEHPLFLQDMWIVQSGRPAHEMHFALSLPPGLGVQSHLDQLSRGQANPARSHCVVLGCTRR